MTCLEVEPFQNDKSITNSKYIQEAFKCVGIEKEFEELHFSAGTYLIDDTVKNNLYSVIAINNGSKTYGDVDSKGNPLTVFKLMDNAPLKPFGCSMPIIGPASSIGQDIEISGIAFDGNNPVGSKNQAPSTAASCAGTNAGVGKNYGKGCHNFIGALKAGFKDCSFHNIAVHDSAGDGFRSTSWVKSSGIKLYNWNINNCGHCGLLLENTTDSTITNCTIITRSNGAVRLQNGCSDIDIQNIHVLGNANDYNPGMQLTGNNITVSDCLIHDTQGPGIEINGLNNSGIEIRNNRFLGCGTFATSQNYGVAGVLINGASVLVENNLFYRCYQNAISCNVYLPDGKSFTKSGFKIDTKNNMIINPLPATANPSVKGNGKALCNLLPETHKMTSEGNYFYPQKNYSWNVEFLD